MANTPAPKPIPVNKMTTSQLFKKYGNANRFDETATVTAPKQAAIAKAKANVASKSKIPPAATH
jgi:hypothetical protein